MTSLEVVGVEELRVDLLTDDLGSHLIQQSEIPTPNLEPWEDPKSRPTLRFCNLHHEWFYFCGFQVSNLHHVSIRVQNWGFYFFCGFLVWWSVMCLQVETSPRGSQLIHVWGLWADAFGRGGSGEKVGRLRGQELECRLSDPA